MQTSFKEVSCDSLVDRARPTARRRAEHGLPISIRGPGAGPGSAPRRAPARNGRARSGIGEVCSRAAARSFRDPVTVPTPDDRDRHLLSGPAAPLAAGPAPAECDGRDTSIRLVRAGSEKSARRPDLWERVRRRVFRAGQFRSQEGAGRSGNEPEQTKGSLF